VSAVVWQNHFRSAAVAELIQEMSLEKSFAFYKDRFADASDFVFVFAGTSNVATMRPLVTRYLASLPSPTEETWRDTASRRSRVVERVVEKGIEPRAGAYRLSGSFRWTPLSACCSACSVDSRGQLARCCGKTSRDLRVK